MEIRSITFSVLTAILIITSTACAISQDTDTSSVWMDKSFTAESGDKLLYNLLNPIDVEDGKSYPLIIFLHGAGERGDDNKAQLVHIAPIFGKDSIRKKYPSYVIFPQCPLNEMWSSVEVKDGRWVPNSKIPATKSLQSVIELIDVMIQKYAIDTNRIYISGLSMGSYGTYDILSRLPDRFAGAISICGGGDIDMVKSYAHVPMKIYHGSEDRVVPPEFSREMYKALLDAGAKDVFYKEYPDGNHNVWNRAYSEPGILDWLFSQRKN